MTKIKYPIYINFLNLFLNISLYFFVITNLDINKFYALLFYLSSFFLVFYSFNFKTIFFEKFLSIFVWLGFPFKLAIPYVALSFGYELNLFPESLSYKNFSNNVYNDAIIFSLCGILGFIAASIVRKKYIFFYPIEKNLLKKDIWFFYEKNKSKILFIYIIAFVSINFFNLYFEIYQKGISSDFAPKFLIVILKWLLLMGLSSFACCFVYYDLVKKKNYHFTSALFLLESFFSNISILSRAFIFNVGILFISFFHLFKNNVRIKLSVVLGLLIFSILLFFLNINISTKLRSCVVNYQDIDKSEKIFFSKNCLAYQKKFLDNKISATVNKISSLSFARWVGIDSMMAVMSKKESLNLGYYTFFLKEKKILDEKSYYEKYFLNRDKSKAHIINTNHILLPGFISYQSISGSKFFVFLSCFVLGIIGAYLEKFSYRYSYNNFILSSLISYLFVFRIIHFGYLPSNTLIYFLAIIFTFLQFKLYNFILLKIKEIKIL